MNVVSFYSKLIYCEFNYQIMNYNLLKHLTGLLCSVSCFTAIAQQDNVVVGGDVFGDSGSIAFTVGQLNYYTFSDVINSIDEGVQKAYKPLKNLGTDKWDLAVGIAVYPNPTVNELHIDMPNFKVSTFSYNLYDVQGKLLLSNGIKEQLTLVNTDFLPSGTYMLKIMRGKESMQ